MNKFLKDLVLKANAPKEVIDELWFAIFCQKFAHILITEMEEPLVE